VIARACLLVTLGAGSADADDAPAAGEAPAHDHGHDHAAHDAHAHDDKPAHDPAAHASHGDGHAGHQAEHHGTLLGAHHRHAHGSSYTMSLGLIAARYDARLYAGDYQGVVAGVRWARGRFGAAATVPAYRLTKNGKVVRGLGDVMAHGHVTLAARGAVAAGLMLMMSAPTGDDHAGLGMGHVMVMPEAWVAWAIPTFALIGSVGYSRALGGDNAHAEHGGGMWPLVDPMNASELPYGTTAMYALAPQLAVGARLAGAIPLDDGDHRLYGGVRVAWSAGRIDTAAEILGGIVGDPFGVRGVVETSVRFD